MKLAPDELRRKADDKEEDIFVRIMCWLVYWHKIKGKLPTEAERVKESNSIISPLSALIKTTIPPQLAEEFREDTFKKLKEISAFKITNEKTINNYLRDLLNIDMNKMNASKDLMQTLYPQEGLTDPGFCEPGVYGRHFQNSEPIFYIQNISMDTFNKLAQRITPSTSYNGDVEIRRLDFTDGAHQIHYICISIGKEVLLFAAPFSSSADTPNLCDLTEFFSKLQEKLERMGVLERLQGSQSKINVENGESIWVIEKLVTSKIEGTEALTDQDYDGKIKEAFREIKENMIKNNKKLKIPSEYISIQMRKLLIDLLIKDAVDRVESGGIIDVIGNEPKTETEQDFHYFWKFIRSRVTNQNISGSQGDILDCQITDQEAQRLAKIISVGSAEEESAQHPVTLESLILETSSYRLLLELTQQGNNIYRFTVVDKGRKVNDHADSKRSAV